MGVMTVIVTENGNEENNERERETEIAAAVSANDAEHEAESAGESADEASVNASVAEQEADSAAQSAAVSDNAANAAVEGAAIAVTAQEGIARTLDELPARIASEIAKALHPAEDEATVITGAEGKPEQVELTSADNPPKSSHWLTRPLFQKKD